MNDDPDPGSGGAQSKNSQLDERCLIAAHERSGTLELKSFEALVSDVFSVLQTLDGIDARGLEARLVEASPARQEPMEDGSRQPFRLQFEFPAETDIGQNTFLLDHPSTGRFWAMLVPVSQSPDAFVMTTFFS